MRLLVTGAAGFVGGHLISHLAGRHELHCISRGPAVSSDSRIEWIELDLVDDLSPRKLPSRVDAVVHLAQSRFYRDFPNGAADVFDVNVRSTFQLLEYARHAGAECFLYASTGGVYGYSYERFAETDPVNPLNFYLSSKYSSELLIANYRRFFRTLVFRFFFVYGPGQRGMLIPNLIGQVERGETVVLRGRPGIRTNPVYVGDAVCAFEPALALETSGVFNIAGDEVVDLTELVQLIGELVGRRPAIEYAARDADGDLIGDNSRMKELLGIRPRVGLREGLRLLLVSRTGTVQ